MFQDLQGLGSLVIIISTIAGLVWWLSVQLNAIKEIIYVQVDKTNTKIEQIEKNLLEKIEYHERHDDKRFNDISNSLWEIRLRNAASDKLKNLVKDNH